ncbi:MAG: LysM domain-containing protein [Acidobacteriota bacterium]
MSKQGWNKLLLGAAILGLGPTIGFAQQPPIQLHQAADGHWTAWNVPTEVPEGTRAYTVQTGDSLWSIAQQMLGDPHLWPQIWQQNQYILDAHWIYPGDRLIVAGAAVAENFGDPAGVAGAPLEQGAAGSPESAGEISDLEDDPFSSVLDTAPTEEGLGLFTGREQYASPDGPVPLGYEADIYCSGYIGDLNEEFAYSIASSEYEFLTPALDAGQNSIIQGIHGKASTEKYGLGLGDIVYLDGGRADGLSPGELLTAVRPGDKIHHPKDQSVLGRLYQYMGRIRVLSAQSETAIAEIVQLCTPIPVGSVLKIFEPEPIPLRKITPIRPVNFPVADDELDGAPTIVIAWDKLLTLGAGYLVYIDHGNQEDMAPGDIFTIYRRGRRGFPPTILGELAVLSVFERTALARILRSRYTVFVGDTLHLK